MWFTRSGPLLIRLHRHSDTSEYAGIKQTQTIILRLRYLSFLFTNPAPHNLHELEHGQKDWRGLHSTPFSVLPSFFTPLHSPLLYPPAVWDLCKLPDPVRSRPKYSYDYQLIAVAVSICYLLWPPCVADADIVFSSCSVFFFLSIFFLSSLKLAARCPVNGCWPSCWYWDEPSDPVYTIQPVVTPVKHPVEQPAASCK